MIGPRNPISQELHQVKYRQRGESFDDFCVRYARTTADDEPHFRKLLEGLRSQAILPAGRQQRAVGWPFQTTAFNCFLGGVIRDDTRAIGDALTEAMLTLRSGGGCGWDFGTLRPHGEPIRGLGDDAYASGPVSFMGMWHAMCDTIRSAGERRGAMMGVLPVWHPDIISFVRAKENNTKLTNFNISVGVTDKFMEALYADKLFQLEFGGRRFRDIRAVDLWAVIMENNWDWAEPGVLFLDTINLMNPLYYCEYIYATNPCSEQPLPPDGACLLLSLNLVKYLVPTYAKINSIDFFGQVRQGSVRGYEIDFDKFRYDVVASVRACDNVFENTVYPLEAQKKEAFAKRRMGVGITGTANALEICGHPYATPGYIDLQSKILEVLRDTAYETSIDIAKAKGSFPLFDAEKWLASGYGKTVPEHIRHDIKKYGLRNGLLLSIAPTGTISFTADNISASIEPPCVIEGERVVNYADGKRTVTFNDWAYEEHGIKCRTALDCTPSEHIQVLCAAQKYIDSSISKTVNFRGAKETPAEEDCISFNQFKNIYKEAYDGGAKGCSTYNFNGKRAGIIFEKKSGKDANATAQSNGQVHEEDAACYTDPLTGAKTCG